MNALFDLTWLFLHILYEYLLSLVRLFYRGRRKSITGKVVLITGAGSGIGQKMAVKFAELGATVVGWDINEIGLQQTRELIRAQMGEDDGGNDNSSTTHDYIISAAAAAVFHSRVVDITDREAVYKAACTLVQTAGGPVSILVNNAGIVSDNKFVENKNDTLIEKTFQVNVIAHFWLIKAFLPQMIEQRSGHIVTIASVAGLNATGRLTDYCASKFAAVGLDESLRFEMKARGLSDVIKTTVVCPYLTNTGMFQGSSECKYPWIFPILDPDLLVRKVMDGILRNTEFIIVPRHCSFLVLMKSLIPLEAWVKCCDLMGGNELFTNLIGRSHSAK